MKNLHFPSWHPGVVNRKSRAGKTRFIRQAASGLVTFWRTAPLKKTILEIYALSVCFITVVCFVVALGLSIYGVIGIANPEFTMNSWAYTQHQTNDAFWNSPPGDPFRSSDEKMRTRPSDADLTLQREQSYVRAVATERREGAQSVVKTMIVIVIDLVVFLFHWLIARRARTQAA